MKWPKAKMARPVSMPDTEPWKVGPWEKLDESYAVETYLPQDQVEGLVEAAADFLALSEQIERSGSAGAMEEYENGWHDLRTALANFKAGKDS